MTVKALSPTSTDLSIDGVWAITVAVVDQDGCPVVATPVVSVTAPDGSNTTPAVVEDTRSRWTALVDTPDAGRYVAGVVAAGYGSTTFTAYVEPVVGGSGMPTTEDLGGTNGYLGSHSFTDEKLQDVLDAEAANQRRVCRIPAEYSADLRRALLRRCARSLAFERLPLSVIQGDADSNNVYPGRDPEVRRLESPYRKLPVG